MSKALSVCSSLTVIAVLVYQTEIVPCLPLPATSALFSLSFSWMDKIWINLNKLTLRIYIFLFLLSIVCLLPMYGFVSLLSSYYAVGKEGGRGWV